MNFSHSGNIGDVICGLPALIELSKESTANLFLKINVKAGYPEGLNHPCGEFRMIEKGAKFIMPLLDHQPYINSVSVLTNEHIDVKLDAFRESKHLSQRFGHIPRWYFSTFPVNADLSLPWLFVTPIPNDYIIISRTKRYRNNNIDFSFLNKYDNIRLIGFEDEYLDLKRKISKLEYLDTPTALNMAQYIAGCKLFIGNSSFCFALAEALKVRRILEICNTCGNMVPTGKDAWDFNNQDMFKQIVQKLMKG